MKATGTYYGIPFTGIVVKARQHTCRPFPMCYTVEFDAPVKLPFMSEPVESAIINDSYSAGDGEGCTITIEGEVAA